MTLLHSSMKNYGRVMQRSFMFKKEKTITERKAGLSEIMIEICEVA